MRNLIDLIGVSREAIPSRIFAPGADVDVYDDPPARTYLSSMCQGFSLVLEDERVTAIQIYIQSTDGFEAFSDELPFDLHATMTPDALCSKFGTPISDDAAILVFKLPEAGMRLIAQYDERNLMEMISIEEGAAPLIS